MPDPAHPPAKRDFHCHLCKGRILIPWDLPPTTGPCPHCGGEITSPPPPAPVPHPKPSGTPAGYPAPLPAAPAAAAPPLPTSPAAPQAAAPASHSSGPHTPQAAIPPVPLETQPTHTPPPVEPPVTGNPEPPPTSAPTAAAPSGQPAAIPPRRTPPPAAKSTTAARKRKKAEETAQKPRKSSLLGVLSVLFLLALGTAAAVYFAMKEGLHRMAEPAAPAPTLPQDNEVAEAHYLRAGWRKEAYQVLRDYMKGQTTQEKLSHVLNADKLAERIEDFYGGGVIQDADTPADAFSPYELSEEDRRRGLFMMIYDQPPQFDMREFFRPLASLEVQYGLDEADLLLSTLARVGNFAMEPLRVHAFFKRTPQGLKLDWEVFAQTKYRTLQNFIDLPEAGHKGVFRAFVMEDVPENGRNEPGTRTYRIADPANTSDSTRVVVAIDSEVGRTLSVVNWRGTNEKRPITRTCTVELAWTGDPSTPRLEIARFICWEFLGLGGQESAPPIQKP